MGYLSAGKDDFIDGRFPTKYLARVVMKALKTQAKVHKEHPQARPQIAEKIRTLRNPKTVHEALRTPEYRQ